MQKAAFHCDHQLLHEKMAELFRTDVRSLNEQEPNLSVLNKGLKGKFIMPANERMCFEVFYVKMKKKI